MLSCVGGIGFNFINFLIAIRRHVIVLPDFYYVCVCGLLRIYLTCTHTQKSEIFLMEKRQTKNKMLPNES